MMEIYKPVFIVGAPRSGTTILYDLMACHKDLASFSPADLREILSEEFLQFEYLRRRLFEIRGWQFSRDGFEVRFTTSFETPHEAGLFWNRWIKKSWAKAKDVTISEYEGLRNTIENLLIRKAKKRFLSKSPAHSIKIEYLNEVFPGAIFVNIIRDGRPVVCSMSRSGRLFNNTDWYFGLPLKKNNQMDFDLFERHARQWMEVNEEIQRAKNNLNNDQYYELKYEDLMSHPKKTIDNIFKFCELEDYNIFDKEFRRISDSGEIQKISEKMTSANEKYKEELEQSDIQRLDEIMKELLVRFEYL